MAKIISSVKEKVFRINKWLGVNECPDGDTGLRMGEASVMQNFRITDDYSLQTRPGSKNVAGLLSQYAIDVAAEPVILREEVVDTTATFSVKPNISLSETGLLSLSGEEATLNYANHQNYTGYYYVHTDGNIYKFVDCEYNDGIVDGVQQYRWSKWNATTSYYSYYTLSFRNIGSVYNPDGYTGYSSYSFYPYTGKFSPSGSLIHITNSGTVYNSIGGETATGGGYFDIFIAEIGGPYYGSTTSKGSTFLGYVYGAYGAYPNGGAKTVDGTTYWFDNRVESKEYKWKFAPVTVVSNESDTVVRGIWSGMVAGNEYIVGACNGRLWSLSTDESGVWSKEDIGLINTDNPVHMFGFDDKLYIINGIDYLVWEAKKYKKHTYTADGTEVAGDYYITIGEKDYIFTLTDALEDGDLLVFDESDNSLSLNNIGVTVTQSAHTTETDFTEGLVESEHFYKVSTVTGYRPLVSVARSPDGAQQQLLEQVNLLNGLRRIWCSPDGVAKDFILPEKPVASVDYVKNLTTGDNINPSDYTANTTDGKVTFTNAPTAGTNSIEIGYTVSNSAKNEVTAMRYSEIYNGVTDNRVFLYGDGSNKAIYSGLDSNGQARADYFPALNVVHIGDSGTPITGMARHYSELIVFKTNGAFAINYDTITLPDGQATAGFYVRPINSVLGNEALGQVQTVENNPRTLESGGIYEWRIVTGAVHDQRNAVRISQRVGLTLRNMDLLNAVTYYDKLNHEYYVMYDGKMLVHNVTNDTWYIYDNLPATCMITYKDELYFGTTDGYIRHLSRDYMSDNGENIVCYWQSGSMDFGAGHLRKYSDTLWVGIKPEAYGFIRVTVQTDKNRDYPDEEVLANMTDSVATGFFSFFDLDFTRLSFNVSDRAKMERIKFKVKNFTYYTLILSSNSNNTKATVTNIDIKVRYTGYAR